MDLNLPREVCRTSPRRKEMLGWMILFAIMALFGAVLSLGENPGASVRIASLVFTTLFFLGLLTYAARGRTR
jgi:uncharacterized membrane protein YtjA (UPF0391 family)